MISLLAALALAQPQDFPKDLPPAKPKTWFVFLNTGKPLEPKPTAEESRKNMQGHLGNFERLYAEGRLLWVGPLTDNGFIRGILVVQAPRKSDLGGYFRPDPLIAKGALHPEILEFDLRHSTLDNRNGQAPMVQNTLVIVKKGEQWGRPLRGLPRYALLPSEQAWAKSGDVALYGTFRGGGEKLGILYFFEKDAAKVRALLDADPLVARRAVTYETHPQFMADWFKKP